MAAQVAKKETSRQIYTYICNKKKSRERDYCTNLVVPGTFEKSKTDETCPHSSVPQPCPAACQDVNITCVERETQHPTTQQRTP